MESRTDDLEMEEPVPDRVSRHVMLANSRGVITELELVGATAGSGEMYVIRYHRASRDAGRILDAGSWIGFRYRDAHWSFVKQTD